MLSNRLSLWCALLALAIPLASLSALSAGAATVHKKSKTFISWGNPGGTSLASGFNNIDTAMIINCGNAAGCTVEVDAMVGIGYTAAGHWAICAVVDGSFLTNPPCWNQGSLNPNGVTTGNSSQSIAVSTGNHTVQTRVYVDADASLEDWHIDYVLFAP